jgi:hypothetical protein
MTLWKIFHIGVKPKKVFSKIMGDETADKYTTVSYTIIQTTSRRPPGEGQQNRRIRAPSITENHEK